MLNPGLAVTLVENHDTQPLQALESPVAAWFKPLAYALILLRQDGYPCIFFADLYEAPGSVSIWVHVEEPFNSVN